MVEIVLTTLWGAMLAFGSVSIIALVTFMAIIALKQGNQYHGFRTLAEFAATSRFWDGLTLFALFGFGLCIYLAISGVFGWATGRDGLGRTGMAIAGVVAAVAASAFGLFFTSLFSNIVSVHCKHLDEFTELQVLTARNGIGSEVKQLCRHFEDEAGKLMATGSRLDEELAYIYRKRIAALQDMIEKDQGTGTS